MKYELMLLALGVATHFIKQLLQMKREGKEVTPFEYWSSYPYQSSLSVIGSIVGFVALMEAGQLTLLTAYSVGYMSNSVSEVIGSRKGGGS